MERRLVRYILPAAVCIALIGFPAPVRADQAEIEFRLKSAEVPPELRARVHRAIDRAVEWLASQQLSDGRVHYPGYDIGVLQMGTGVTALAGLAAVHASTPRGREVASKAIGYLVPREGRQRGACFREIYTGGITVMLLEAARERPDDARTIARGIAEAQQASGWWGYMTRESEHFDSTGANLANLSTSQFAALGLWAGDRTGAETPGRVWLRHLESLCDLQEKDGSWGYTVQRGKGYGTGALMGFANLVLAIQALKDRDALPDDLARRAQAALDVARGARDREVLSRLRAMRRGQGWDGYALYALEKACIFGGEERIGGLPWYAQAAEVLVDTQNPDGGWGAEPVSSGSREWRRRSEVITTAFALLFLVRAPEHDRTATPRPLDFPRVTATPGPDPAAPADPAPAPKPPAPPIIPLADAEDALDLLEGRVRDPSVENTALLPCIDFLLAARRGLAPDGPLPAPGAPLDEGFVRARKKWTTRAANLLLKAFVLERPVARPPSNQRTPVNIRAAEVLASFDAETSPYLIRALEAGPIRTRGYDPDPLLYRAAFRTLARWGDPEAMSWLAESAIRADADPDRRARAREGLAALGEFRGVPGAVRRAALEKLANLFLGAENAAAAEPAVPSARAYWEEMGEPVVMGLRELARDPDTGLGPANDDGQWAASVERLKEWLISHRDLKASPWTGVRER